MIYNVILCYLYFYKSRIKSPEIRIYGYLLIVNFLGLFLELYNRFSIAYLGADNFFTPYTCKIYLLYYIVYIVLFFNYFLAISFSERKYRKYSIFFYIFSILAVIGCGYLMINLPVQINTDKGIYLTGPGIETMFSLMSIFLVLIISVYIIRYRHIDKNKYIPCLAFIILSATFGFVQKYFPFITLTTSMQTIVLYIMYNTIENPDAKMYQQVTLAKLLFERSNNMRKETMSELSREIRNPLNSIIGFTEDIKKYEKKLPIEINEDINYILESSNNILEIVDNITDIKDGEITDLELTLKPYSLKKEINTIKNRFKTKMNNNINFIVNMDDSIPDKLIGDKTYINEIISNLLSMSLKSTNKGEIELFIKGNIKNNKCNLLITIKDSGIGYKRDKLLELRNIGVNSNIKVNEENLLFAITKNIVILMDGKIDIESKHKYGTTITIEIPQNLFVEENVEETDIIVDYSSKTILVVDDNTLNIKVLSRALSDFKIKIDSAQSGEEAISKVTKGIHYDLILMDIMMPVMGGEEALSNLKQNPDFNTPVIALTADATTGAKEKYMASGFVDYLTKPFSRDTIAKKLDNIFENTK